MAHPGVAQPPQGFPQEKATKKSAALFIAPAALIGAGIFVFSENGILDRHDIKEWREMEFANFSTPADDYLRFVPSVVGLGLSIAGANTDHKWAKAASLFTKSSILAGFIVTAIKYVGQVRRPDGGSPNAFPSGHTATAFVGATFLHREFGKTHPWVSVLAYSCSASVGLLRILNNRHWASDVLVGAGIGMLMTNFVYMLDERAGKKKETSLSVNVQAGNTVSLGLSIPISSIARPPAKPIPTMR